MPETCKHEAGKRPYLEDFARPVANGGPGWLQELRRRGLERFEATPLPHSRQEAWRYTDIRPIVETPFRALTGPDADGQDLSGVDAAAALGDTDDAAWAAELVFVNGFLYSARTGPEAEPASGADVASLANAARTRRAIVRAHLDRHIGDEDAFTALNSAFLRDGAFVHIPKNTLVEKPIHLVFVTVPGFGEFVAHPRVLIVAGPNSESAVVERHVCAGHGPAYFSNTVAEAVLAKGARLRHYKVVEEGPQGYHLGAMKVVQGAGSVFGSCVLTLGGRIARNALAVALEGEGAECALDGLYLNDGDRLTDNALRVEHRQPRCLSRVLYKGILAGTSRAAFTGSVVVERHAQRSDSNQLNSNLLLSDEARVNTKPQLRIFADDVKCTHGATIGPPPEEAIYYFRTRGIGEQTARRMLTYGFAEGIVKRIASAPLRTRMDAYVYRHYLSGVLR